jgi:hypothetical protein
MDAVALYSVNHKKLNPAVTFMHLLVFKFNVLNNVSIKPGGFGYDR